MQVPNLSLAAFKQSALLKADSIYSSYNVPTIKDQKMHRFRPMTTKQPRKIRQKIDEKFIKDDASSEAPNPNLPTVWNINNSNCPVQMPFKNFHVPSESSLTVQDNLKSTGFSKMNRINDYDSLKERIFKNTPSGLQDLTKPVLSLRKEAKDEYDQSMHSSMIQYYNKMVSQKESAERKQFKKSTNFKSLLNKNRINTAVPSSKDSMSMISNHRAKTKEGNRQKLIPESGKIQNIQKHSISNLNDRGLFNITEDSKEKPIYLKRIDEKRPSLRVRRKKISSGSGILKRNQMSNIDKDTEKSDEIYCSDRIKLPGKKQRLNSSKAAQMVNQHRKHSKFSERREHSDNFASKTPYMDENGGMFGLNLEETSFQDVKELGFSFKGSQSTNSRDGKTELKYRTEIIDWSKTKIFQMVLDGDIELNKEKDK